MKARVAELNIANGGETRETVLKRKEVGLSWTVIKLFCLKKKKNLPFHP